MPPAAQYQDIDTFLRWRSARSIWKHLVADQAAHPLFGSNLTYPLSDYIRLHQTSGTTGFPLKILDTQESWDWWGESWKTVYQGSGVTQDDIVFLAFGFGPFIGFWSAYEGAKKLGALTSIRSSK